MSPEVRSGGSSGSSGSSGPRPPWCGRSIVAMVQEWPVTTVWGSPRGLPPREPGDLDGHDGSARGIGSVLSILLLAEPASPFRLLPVLQDPSGASGPDPPDPIPVLFVVIHHQLDVGVLPDIGQALQLPGALR